MEFENIVWKGNKMGAGFIRIPKEQYSSLKLGENVKAEILCNKTITFYPTVSNYKNYIGFYIPQTVCEKDKLLKKKIKVRVEKIDGFHSKLGYDGRLYIPKIIAEKYNLSEDSLILLEGSIEDKRLERICKIYTRKRKETKEYSCFFSSKNKDAEGVFIIKKILKKSILTHLLSFVLSDVNHGMVEPDKIIAFYTTFRPIIMPYKMNMDANLVYYLGCYFADGIKKGPSWGITASTFEQANFYLKMHKGLILNSSIKPYISITSKSSINKDELARKWKNACGIPVENVRLRISEKKSAKVNPNGSLVMREYSQSPQRFYNRLLTYCIQKILKEKNRKLALEFVLGILEGDGSPSASSRGHIIISTNSDNVKTLEKILNVTDLDFGVEVDFNKASVRLNSLGILSNIDYLKDKIFKYYPKRRKKFIERFSKVGAVRFILGQQNYCSGWVKAWLRNYRFLDENYQLTSKGLKLKNNLRDLVKSTLSTKVIKK